MGNVVLLELDKVTKSYASPGGGPSVPVLKEISLKVAQGESVAITGPSGSGKSTLLNLIGTLDRPTTGIIRFAGQDVSQRSDPELARLRNQVIGFIFQQHHLLPQCTALENVLVPTLPRLNRRRDRSEPRTRLEAQDRAEESPWAHGRRLLERLGLGARLDYRPGQLSGGERQRVALVRALINHPKMLLADEPTGALDQASADHLAELLVEVNREEKVTLILVTHALDLANRTQHQFRLRLGRLEE